MRILGVEEHLLVIGGCPDAAASESGIATRVFSLRGSHQAARCSMPLHRSFAGCVSVSKGWWDNTVEKRANSSFKTGRVFVIGGYDAALNLCGDMQCYDPATDEWSDRRPTFSLMTAELPSLMLARAGHQCVTISSSIYVSRCKPQTRPCVADVCRSLVARCIQIV